jgi:DNA-binding NarL/FixJ family response regulator
VAIALEGASRGDGDGPTASTGHEVGELSAREMEVARLVASGLANPAVAAELFVSVVTVKTRVSHIPRSPGLDSRVQLANWVADRSRTAVARPPSASGPNHPP